MREWLLFAVAAVFLLLGYLSQHFSWFAPDTVETVIHSDCDLRQQSCDLELAGKQLKFAITPRDIQVLQPLVLQLQTGALLPAAVSVEFEGLNMDMGYNRVVLEPDSPGIFSARALLPACTQARMQWLLHMRIDAGNDITDIQFRLDTQRR